MKFVTRLFGYLEIGNGSLDKWMNSFLDGAHGVAIAGTTTISNGLNNEYAMVTIKIWNRAEVNTSATTPTRLTIDEIPEEPTINYPEGDLPNEEL